MCVMKNMCSTGTFYGHTLQHLNSTSKQGIQMNLINRKLIFLIGKNEHDDNVFTTRKKDDAEAIMTSKATMLTFTLQISQNSAMNHPVMKNCRIPNLAVECGKELSSPSTSLQNRQSTNFILPALWQWCKKTLTHFTSV